MTAAASQCPLGPPENLPGPAVATHPSDRSDPIAPPAWPHRLETVTIDTSHCAARLTKAPRDNQCRLSLRESKCRLSLRESTLLRPTTPSVTLRYAKTSVAFRSAKVLSFTPRNTTVPWLILAQFLIPIDHQERHPYDNIAKTYRFQPLEREPLKRPDDSRWKINFSEKRRDSWVSLSPLSDSRRAGRGGRRSHRRDVLLDGA